MTASEKTSKHICKEAGIISLVKTAPWIPPTVTQKICKQRKYPRTKVLQGHRRGQVRRERLKLESKQACYLHTSTEVCAKAQQIYTQTL